MDKLRSHWRDKGGHLITFLELWIAEGSTQVRKGSFQMMEGSL